MSIETTGRGRSRLRRVLPWLGLATAAYLIVGNLLHRVVFPLPSPDPATYPRPGDVMESRIEGFRMQVLAVEEGWMHGELVLAPGAAGPPLHYHEGFAEEFSVARGTLHIELADRIAQVPAGGRHRVERGVAHRPFNPTAEPVVVSGGRTMPLEFAACLVQLYDLMDETGNGPAMLLQYSLNNAMCDTHLARIPRWAERALQIVVGPLARLAGFRDYYPARSLHPPGGTT